MRINNLLKPRLLPLLALLLSPIFSYPISRTKEDWKTRIIYQVLLDRFWRASDRTRCEKTEGYCGGNFLGLGAMSRYISGLGFDAVSISPIFKSQNGNFDGYDYTVPTLFINASFGNSRELSTCISSLHFNNIWVMLEITIPFTSKRFVIFFSFSVSFTLGHPWGSATSNNGKGCRLLHRLLRCTTLIFPTIICHQAKLVKSLETEYAKRRQQASQLKQVDLAVEESI